MKLLTFVALHSALTGVLAAPVSDACLAKERSKIRSCDNFRVDQDNHDMAFLHADCQGFDQDEKKWRGYAAGLDLNKCIKSVNGHLQEGANGNFAPDCTDMNVKKDNKGQVILTATCSGPPPHDSIDNSIYLGSFISVKDGELTCFGLKEKDCPECWQK
ncbi:hypothetical protein CHU98_g5885 [Xylaria longipes]|nr:hypothetical protein CHU98_g5885 [Xylaria longipes]